MEERMGTHVEQILSQYPKVRFVEFHSCQGYKIEPSRDLILDIHGIDITLHLENRRRLKVQVKCGTKENFLDWGKQRQSLVLGKLNDITMDRIIDTPIRFCDLLLTGYELKHGIFGPWALIKWPQLLLRAHHDAIKIENDLNSRDNTRFAWADRFELQRCKVIFGEFFNFDAFA